MRTTFFILLLLLPSLGCAGPVSAIDGGSTSDGALAIADTGLDSGSDAGSDCPVGTHRTETGCDATLSWTGSSDLPSGVDHHGTIVVEEGDSASLHVIGGWNGSGVSDKHMYA